MVTTFGRPVFAPLLTPDVDGVSVRLFASPLFDRDGSPDLPWHSTDDLRAAMRLGEGLDEALRRSMRAGLGDRLLTVATRDGLTTIASYDTGLALARAVGRRRGPKSAVATARLVVDFRDAHVRALPLMVARLSDRERLDFALRVLGRSDAPPRIATRRTGQAASLPPAS